MKLLTENGLDISRKYYYELNNIFILACCFHNENLIDYLIEKNADKNISDNNFEILLMIPCYYNNFLL